MKFEWEKERPAKGTGREVEYSTESVEAIKHPFYDTEE